MSENMKTDSDSNEKERIRRNDEFEALLSRHLHGELTAQEGEKLERWIEQSADYQKKFNRVAGMQNLLDRIPAGSLDDLLDELSPVMSTKNKVRRIRPVWIVSSAAASVILSLGAFFLWRMQNQSGMELLSDAQGHCQSDGVDLTEKRGTIGRTLQSDKEFPCSVEIDQGGRIALRLSENSKVVFYSTANVFHIKIDSGRIYLDVSRRPRQSLHIDAPGSTVRILGTKIIVERSADGNLAVDLMEGRAEVRTGLSLLSESVQNIDSVEIQDAAARDLPEIFKLETEILESGDSARIVKLFATPAQGRLIAELNSRAANISAENPTSEQIKKTSGLLTDLGHVLLSETPGYKPGISVIAVRRGRPESIDRSGPPSGNENAVQYRLKLKDGRTITGSSPEQEGDRYRIQTRNGEMLIPQNQVENIELVK